MVLSEPSLLVLRAVNLPPVAEVKVSLTVVTLGVLLPAFLLLVLESLLPEAWIGRVLRKRAPTEKKNTAEKKTKRAKT